MQVISFTVNGAEYEYPEDFDNKVIFDPIEFVRRNIICPLILNNFEKGDLENVFDSNWLSNINPEEGCNPTKIIVHRATTSDRSIEFDATFYYEVQLSGENVDDEFIEENLSWPTDMIDYLMISFDGDVFEEIGVGEKLGPNVVS